MPKQAAAEWDHEAFTVDVLAFCERQGWSRCRLAREAGLYHYSIYSWLDGKSPLGLKSVVAIAHACDLSLDRYAREAVAAATGSD